MARSALPTWIWRRSWPRRGTCPAPWTIFVRLPKATMHRLPRRQRRRFSISGSVESRAAPIGAVTVRSCETVATCSRNRPSTDHITKLLPIRMTAPLFMIGISRRSRLGGRFWHARPILRAIGRQLLHQSCASELEPVDARLQPQGLGALGGNFLSGAPTFVGTHEVYATGTSAEGLQTGPVDLGSQVVSQGQDFTLTLGTSESFVNLGTGATLSLPLSATGLNGFTGSITLNTQIVGGSGGCFVFMGTPPTSIAANSQTTITVRNNNCTSGYLDFIVVGTVPGNNIFHSTSYAMLQAMPTGDFNIGVSGPYPAVLSPQTGVSYTVTVSPTNGLTTGCVSLSLGPGSLPAGVTYSLPSAVCLNGSGSVTASLNFSASPITPPGTWPLQVTGTLGSTHTAALSLSTQVTTFQVTSATGSAIVHNTGHEVQTVQSAKDGNLPSNPTCAPAAPDRHGPCRVVSSSPGTVTIGITAGTGAVHGTRVLSLNGGAAPVLMAVADYWGGSGLPTITVDAGGSASLDINLPVACDAGIDEEDESCGFGATVTSSASWITSFDGIGVLTIYVDPPAYTPTGSYSYSVDLCGGYFDPGESYSCE